MGGRARAGAGVVLGWAIGLGCSMPGVFTCSDGADCESDAGSGVCQLDGYCSFPDDDCASGQRYGGYAGDGLAGQCVEPPTGSSSGDDESSSSPPPPPPPATTTGVDDGGSSSSGGGDETTGPPPPICGGLDQQCCEGGACDEGLCLDDVCRRCGAEVEAEEYFTCAVRIDGQLSCWGADAYGQVGDGPPAEPLGVPLPGFVLEGVTAVDLGAFHACALGDGLWCWGRDEDAQLGQGLPGPPQASPVPIDAPSPVVEVAAGGFHTCARDRSGQVWCWGRNEDEQIGTGDGLVVPEPFALPELPDARAIDVGGFHSCAIDAGGQVWCWGSNEYRQLGRVGTTTNPQVVDGLPPVEQLALGDYHSCALDRAGVVWCWGRNHRGQIGQPGGVEFDDDPVIVEDLPAIEELASGDDHVCGRAGSEVWCWGSNLEGQLGVEPSMDGLGPQLMPFPSAAQVAAGRSHTCVSTGEGLIQCLGGNSLGQLGDGTVTEAIEPVTPIGICP